MTTIRLDPSRVAEQGTPSHTPSSPSSGTFDNERMPALPPSNRTQSSTGNDGTANTGSINEQSDFQPPNHWDAQSSPLGSKIDRRPNPTTGIVPGGISDSTNASLATPESHIPGANESNYSDASCRSDLLGKHDSGSVMLDSWALYGTEIPAKQLGWRNQLNPSSPAMCSDFSRGNETTEPDVWQSSIRDAQTLGSEVSTFAWPSSLSAPEVGAGKESKLVTPLEGASIQSPARNLDLSSKHRLDLFPAQNLDVSAEDRLDAFPAQNSDVAAEHRLDVFPAQNSDPFPDRNMDLLPHLSVGGYENSNHAIEEILNDSFLGNNSFGLNGIENYKPEASKLLGDTVTYDQILGLDSGISSTALDHSVLTDDVTNEHLLGFGNLVKRNPDQSSPNGAELHTSNFTHDQMLKLGGDESNTNVDVTATTGGATERDLHVGTDTPWSMPVSIGIQFDSAGQLIHRDYANGHASGFEHAANGQVTKFTESGSGGQVSRQFTRQADTSAWNVVDKDGKSAGIWHGEITTDEHGGWSFSDYAKGVKPRDNRATYVDARGDKTIVRTTDSGATLVSDQSDKLTDVKRANGTSVQIENTGDGPETISTDGVPGADVVSFAYDPATKIWHSDQANIADSTTSPVTADGHIDYKMVDGNKITINPDGTSVIHKFDGSVVDVDAGLQPVRCTATDGSVRTLDYDQDRFVGYTDQTKNAADPEHPFAPDRHTLGAGELMRPTPLGDIEFISSSDGSRRVLTSNMGTVYYNEAGQVYSATLPNGSCRHIGYDPVTNQPSTITDMRESGGKQLQSTYELKPGTTDFVLTDSGDPHKLANDVRRSVQLGDNGNYTYVTESGERRCSPVGDQIGNPSAVFNSGDIAEARFNYVETMRPLMGNDDKRTERLEEMMHGFEKRMFNTIERRVDGGEDQAKVSMDVEKKVADAYTQLTRLAGSDGQTFDDKATRAQFAEIAMYHFWWPQSVTQQGWNSCWSQSQWIINMGEHPDAYAKLLSDVSIDGKFTDLTGKTHTMRQSDLAITERRDGKGWSIDTATHDNSQPSPVANRWDRLVTTAGKRGPQGIRSGGDCSEARMQVEHLTGDSTGYVGTYPDSEKKRMELIKHGGAQRNPGPGHLANYELDKVGNIWVLVRGDQYNGRDSVVAKIADLHKWLTNGQSVKSDLAYEPSFGHEYTIKDVFKPSDLKPKDKPDRNPRHHHDDDENPDDQPDHRFHLFHLFRSA